MGLLAPCALLGHAEPCRHMGIWMQDMRRVARGLYSRRGIWLSQALGICITLWLVGQPVIGISAAVQVETPLELYGQLFVDVQLQRVFPDSKAFTDAVPNGAPSEILRHYDGERAQPGFDLEVFVRRNFSLPQPSGEGYRAVPGQDVCDHIDGLWSVLERQPEPVPPYGSLLPLPFPYVVPGGRFTEIYYWDSYFTMLGLEQSGRRTLALDMVRELWQPDRPLRPRAEREPHLLSQPLTAAVLGCDGRAGREHSDQRGRGPEGVSAGTEPRVRLLDGWCRRACARQRTPPGGAPERWYLS